jgi:hypothetical protein
VLGWLAGIAVSAAALFALHRLGLWLDDRGWLYYRRESREGALLKLAAAFDPAARAIQAMQEESRLENGGVGDGDPTRDWLRGRSGDG